MKVFYLDGVERTEEECTRHDFRGPRRYSNDALDLGEAPHPHRPRRCSRVVTRRPGMEGTTSLLHLLRPTGSCALRALTQRPGDLHGVRTRNGGSPLQGTARGMAGGHLPPSWGRQGQRGKTVKVVPVRSCTCGRSPASEGRSRCRGCRNWFYRHTHPSMLQ